MSLPNINPLAAKLMGGRDFREQLRESLLERAEATDDPAYRQRLLEVADGKRPLRTLMHDPGFAPELREEAERLEAEPPKVELDGSPEEVLALLRDQLEAGGGQVPTLEEARALFGEARAIQAETAAVLRAEELTGWGGSVEDRQDGER